jgi:histidyl-tRNA synthetase
MPYYEEEQRTRMFNRAPGVEDIFPHAITKRNHVTEEARKAFARYNIKEIITPIMEFTEVFARGLGDETDIVSKEMFTFEDRGGRSLTLRPEGTASVVRAFVENGEYNRLALNKFFYIGSMFRAERPQKGRLRQFNQLGVEIFGSEDPWYDFESISVMNDITRELGITHYELLVNSIGCDSCRPSYLEKLKEYYKENFDNLCDDCKRRYNTNILRLLDCKVESCSTLKNNAPKITESLCHDCHSHHTEVTSHLDNAGISYREDPSLVRGLDYYTRTVFEFVTTALGGQNAFAAGGRYDKLVEQFGGKPTPAVGFAAGIERLMLITEDSDIPESGITAYLVYSGDAARKKALELAVELRARGFSIDLDPAAGGFKGQFKKADREKARFAIVIGDDELTKGSATVKDLQSGEQEEAPFEELADYLKGE